MRLMKCDLQQLQSYKIRAVVRAKVRERSRDKAGTR